MPSKEREDIIGKWSLEKLELLRKYLAGYLTVLKNQAWCRGYEYIDAFAGTGKPKTKDEQQYVDGSPRVALGLRPSFTQYHFIKQADWRVRKLEKMRGEFPDHDIAIYHGDCNKILRERILPQLSYSSKKRAIAFVDPFGMQFEWETMEYLAQTKTVEVLLNFPVMAINRGVLRKHPEYFSRQIHFGALITPTLGFANILCEIGKQKALQRGRKTYSGMMHFEKALKEFQYLRPIFDIPIVILGIDISPL